MWHPRDRCLRLPARVALQEALHIVQHRTLGRHVWRFGQNGCGNYIWFACSLSIVFHKYIYFILSYHNICILCLCDVWLMTMFYYCPCIFFSTLSYHIIFILCLCIVGLMIVFYYVSCILFLLHYTISFLICVCAIENKIQIFHPT